jgi:hypothetical protein
MPGPGSMPCPKPEPRKRTKARAKRHEAAIIQQVRAQCVARDGDCRIGSATTYLGACAGESEWCHLGDMRRFRTRGMDPDVRHTKAGTCCLCTKHHQMLDANEIRVEFMTPDGADGTLRFIRAGGSFLSVPRA